jgi:hypothetical protein
VKGPTPASRLDGDETVVEGERERHTAACWVMEVLRRVRGSMNDTLDGNGGRFTAADAECRDAALQILRLERVKQRHD